MNYQQQVENVDLLVRACQSKPNLFRFVSVLILKDVNLASVGVDMGQRSPAIYHTIEMLQTACRRSLRRPMSQVLGNDEEMIDPPLSQIEHHQLRKLIKEKAETLGPNNEIPTNAIPDTIALLQLVDNIVNYQAYSHAASQLHRSKLSDALGFIIAAGSAASSLMLTYRNFTNPLWGILGAIVAYSLSVSLTAKFNGQSITNLRQSAPTFAISYAWISLGLLVSGYVLVLFSAWNSAQAQVSGFLPNITSSDSETVYEHEVGQWLIPIFILAVLSAWLGNGFNFRTRLIYPLVDLIEKNYVEETAFLYYLSKIPVLRNITTLTPNQETKRVCRGRIALAKLAFKNTLSADKNLSDVERLRLAEAVIRPDKGHTHAGYTKHLFETIMQLSYEKYRNDQDIIQALRYQPSATFRAKVHKALNYSAYTMIAAFTIYGLQPPIRVSMKAAHNFFRTDSLWLSTPMAFFSTLINGLVYGSIVAAIFDELMSLRADDFRPKNCSMNKVFYVLARFLVLGLAFVTALPTWTLGRENPPEWLAEYGAASLICSVGLMTLVYSRSIFLFFEYLRRFSVDMDDVSHFDPNATRDDRDAARRLHAVVIPEVLDTIVNYVGLLDPAMVALVAPMSNPVTQPVLEPGIARGRSLQAKMSDYVALSQSSSSIRRKEPSPLRQVHCSPDLSSNSNVEKEKSFYSPSLFKSPITDKKKPKRKVTSSSSSSREELGDLHREITEEEMPHSMTPGLPRNNQSKSSEISDLERLRSAAPISIPFAPENEDSSESSPTSRLLTIS